MRYRISNDYILREEFFGGILVCHSNSKEYILDFQNLLFLNLLDNGITVLNSIDIVKKIFNIGDFNPDIKKFLHKKVLIKGNDKVNNNKIDEIKNNLIYKINKVKKLDFLSAPLQASLYLTSKCQLDCKFCYFSNKKSQFNNVLNINNWCDIINQLKEMKVISVSLLGGEPTLYENIDKVLIYLDRLKFKTTITTNAVNIPDKVIDIISDSSHICPSISIQSIDEKRNYELMGSSINKVKTVIEKFISNNKYPRINTVITNQTVNEIYIILLNNFVFLAKKYSTPFDLRSL